MYDWILDANLHRTRKALQEEDDGERRARLKIRPAQLEARPHARALPPSRGEGRNPYGDGLAGPLQTAGGH